MFRTQKRLSDAETRLAALSLAVAEIREQLSRSAPAQLFDLVKQLSDDIEATRVSLRSLHGKVAIEKRGKQSSPEPRELSNAEFEAFLELQRGHSGSN